MIGPKLCLGTAQFGLSYGISNTVGQVSETEVANLLARGDKKGVCWLDTAQAYGDAEEVIGRNLPRPNKYGLISKLAPQTQPVFTTRDTERWEKELQSSRRRLGVEVLDALLLHSTKDLLKPGGDLLEGWLVGLRKRGLVRRLGLSIYNAVELDRINPTLQEVVQLPLSLFDQRLLHDGTLKRLRANGTAIHARSVYLQGLLLMPATQWPDWVGPEVRSHQRSLEELANKKKCRMIDLALGFARDQVDLEAIVVGVCSVRELNELEEAWSCRSPWGEEEWRAWQLKDPLILDPRCWPDKKRMTDRDRTYSVLLELAEDRRA